MANRLAKLAEGATVGAAPEPLPKARATDAASMTTGPVVAAAGALVAVLTALTFNAQKLALAAANAAKTKLAPRGHQILGASVCMTRL